MRRHIIPALLAALLCVISLVSLAQAPVVERYNTRYRLTATERELVERIVMAEARGECYEGQMAVAQVILNRLKAPNFPSAVAAVVRSEFAKPYKGKVFECVKRAVHEVFDMGVQIISNEVLYFMNPAKASKHGAAWIRANGTHVMTIGNHEFYMEARR